MSKVSTEFFTLLLGIIGIGIGLYFPSWALSLSFLGDIFILFLKLLIIPLVITSIFLSIASLEINEVKKLGSKTLLYYFSTSSLACLTGLFIANSFSFASGMDFQSVSSYDPTKLNNISVNSFVTNFFSGNIFQSLTSGNIVQIVVFTFFVAMASLKVKNEYRETLIHLSRAIQDVMMVLINWAIKVSPIGIFSLVASIIAKTEMKLFEGLGPLFMAIGLAIFIHTIIVLPLIGYFIGGFNPYAFIFNVKKALVVAFTTASSTATLPISTQVLKDNAAVSSKTSRFVLPLGATLNMDGSALYQAIVILFLGEFSGMSLTLSQQILVFIFVMTSAAGTAGIPGGGIMMMGAVMSLVGIPLENIAIYLLIDRFWDYPITAVNVLGDLFGAKTIDRFMNKTSID